MASLDEGLASELERWKAAGLHRRINDDGPSGRVDFASSDYLGLARDERLIEAAHVALSERGVGPGSARLLSGGSPEHARAEEAAAKWLDAEAALLFPSGYQANIGLLGALAGRGDAIFSDALAHASLIDGARLSRARIHVHGHLDLAELERDLEGERSARRRFIVTEGVFSMDGDAAPLAALAELCLRHDAWLIVDEAHATGVIGPRGAGAWAAADVGGAAAERLAARVVTGGKALGVTGAFVVGSKVLREQLIQRARTFVFTTSPSPVTAAALTKAIEVAEHADEERAHLSRLTGELARRLDLPRPAGAIVPIVLGEANKTVEVAEALQEKGLDVRAVRPPTVPEGSSRLRVVLHASNRESEVDELVRALGSLDVKLPRTSPAAGPEPLFVVGTDTGIGKTVVSALLLRAARRLGPAAYWKPVQTGEDSDTGTVAELAEAEARELMRPAWEFPLPASPHAAAEDAGRTIEPRRLDEGLRGLRRTLPDTRLIVELAGGLLVPYRTGEAPETQADWLARARPRVVLVARSGLGTLNHTLLTVEALRARHVEPCAIVLVGEEHPSNERTLRELTRVPIVMNLLPFAELSLDALAKEAEREEFTAILRPQ